MDFWAHQEDARRRTTRLIVLYAVMVLLLVVAAGYTITAFWQVEDIGYLPSAFSPFYSPLLYYIAGGFLAFIGLLCLFSPASLSAGGKSVAESLNATLIAPQTRDTGERRLLNVVEEMALASGMPVPPVYILKDESGINAFAAGCSINDAVIGVTQGTVDHLTREELQAVVAHEFSHVINGDMRLDLRFAQMLFGLMCLSDFCGAAMRGLTRGSYRSRGGKDRAKGMAVMMLLIGIVWLTGAIMRLFGTIIQAAVNRQREFLADASSVQFTRTTALASALKKIAALTQGSSLDNTAMTGSLRHMFFCSPRSGLFDTHPSLAERIRRLEPQWDGATPTVTAQRVPQEALLAPTLSARNEEASAAWQKLQNRKGVSSAAWLGQLQTGATAKMFAAVPDGEPLSPEDAGSLLRNAVKDPLDASRVVFGLLLGGKADVQARQLAQIKGREAKEHIRTYREAFAALPLDAHLPYIEKAIPALKTFSKTQFEDFQRLLTAFISADGEFSFKEWVLQQLVVSQVGTQYTPGPRIASGSSAISGAAGMVLSALARFTPDSEGGSRCAFQAGANALEAPPTFTDALLNPAKLSESIAVLAQCPPQVKQQFMRAAACVVSHDNHIASEEAMFLRILSLCLGIPVPPEVGKTGVI